MTRDDPTRRRQSLEHDDTIGGASDAASAVPCVMISSRCLRDCLVTLFSESEAHHNSL